MQEEVENRTLALTVNTTKFTGRVLKAAIFKYLSHLRTRTAAKSRDSPKAGRVTMKELQKQYGELRSVEIDDTGTRQFERIARKYHVQYKVFRLEKGKYQIFFKAPNELAMQQAFQEYMKRKVRKASRPSVLEKLQQFKAQVKSQKRDKEKRREVER